MDVGRECQDLGDFDDQVLVFGGAYSNLQALEAILTLARDELHIPPHRIIHTGDVVAYCANPRETSELLLSSGVHCLMGNCEESIGQGKLDCGCGFPEDSACQEYSINWYAHVMKEFQGHDRLCEWMRQLPRRLEFSMRGRRFAVAHGSPAHISKFVWPSTPDEELINDLALLPEACDGIVCGHSGIPFARLVPMANGSKNSSREKLWLNAGVIGMPANDGTTRGWFALLSPNGDDIEVAIRALTFDANKAATAIYAETSLNRGYADALTSGIWPSHDVLPMDEQMATGVALSESTFRWRRQSTTSTDDRTQSSPNMVVICLGLVTAIAVIAASSLLRRNSVNKASV